MRRLIGSVRRVGASARHLHSPSRVTSLAGAERAQQIMEKQARRGGLSAAGCLMPCAVAQCVMCDKMPPPLPHMRKHLPIPPLPGPQMAVLNNTAEEDLGDQDALEAELERELAAAEEAEAEAAGGPGPTPQGKKKVSARTAFHCCCQQGDEGQLGQLTPLSLAECCSVHCRASERARPLLTTSSA